MYGHRGAMYGSGGVSDGYEIGSKRPRMMESTPYFAVNSGPTSYTGSSRGPTSYSTYTRATRLPTGYSTFPLVRLRGLPFNCSDADIFRFFAGLDIVDIFLINKEGRFSGEAFVVFAGQMQAELALERDRQNMGRRYVEVFPCKKQEYYNAIAADVSEGVYGSIDEHRVASPAARRKRMSPDKDTLEYSEVLKMRGLPYSVTKGDIVNFFEDFKVLEDKVQLGFRGDGKATGEAFVVFESADEAKRAMCKDKKMIGSRYVELFPSNPDEAKRVASKSRR